MKLAEEQSFFIHLIIYLSAEFNRTDIIYNIYSHTILYSKFKTIAETKM